MSPDLFSDLPRRLSQEQISTLLSAPNLRIERIVSFGQASPPDFWYDQGQGEWVILLAGSAAILFEGDVTPKALAAGDYLNIPQHTRYRVEWTDADQATVWIAVHYG